jgi:LCP family protein required for cell wall assembly
MKKRVLKKRIILMLLFLISILILNVFIFKVDILPTKYIILSIFIETIIYILCFVLTYLKNKVVNVIGYILTTLFIIIIFVLMFFINKADTILDKSFNKEIVYTKTYYLVAPKDVNDINGDVIYYDKLDKIKDAITSFKDENKYDINPISLPTLEEFKEEFKNHDKYKLMFIEKNSYNSLFELYKDLNKEDYKILAKYKIKDTVKRDTKNKDIYNIYIVGKDFGGRLDFNMIVSVNTKTNKILLTSIPRDYYIDVYGMDGKDKLSYMNIYSMDVVTKSIEKLFDTKLDYLLEIETNSLVKIVDEVGGITYCSNKAFTTDHALVLDTYVDKNAKHLYVKQGCQQLNGIEALTVARERKAFPASDRERQKNCQKIILAIFDKLQSNDSNINYNNVLNDLSALYNTNIPRKTINNLLKSLLNSNLKYEFETNSVDGKDTMNYVNFTQQKDWILDPYYNTVDTAKEKINNILNSK